MKVKLTEAEKWLNKKPAFKAVNMKWSWNNNKPTTNTLDRSNKGRFKVK